MHKSLDLTKLGGVYAYQDSLKFMQEGYGGALDGLAAGLGNKFVLSGCVDSGAAVTDGWVCINGEIMPFVGGAMPGTPKVLVTTTITKELYDDGLEKDFYTSKVASLVSVGDFDYVELQRLPGIKGIMQSLLDVQRIVRLMGVEDAVILEGCAVTNIDDDLDTCDISAGQVLMDGVLIDVEAVEAATFPIYITSDGTWNNSLPAAPYIRFNPHPSQRYADVLRRATTPVGEIKMFETLSDRFDGSGVGRWEMLGFSLMATMQSRLPIGLWFDGDAVTNVTDVNHTAAGNQGGGKTQTLVGGNIPDFDLDIPGTNGANFIAHNNNSRVAAGTTGGDVTISLSTDGDGNPFNIANPYTVVVYAKRTA